MEGVGNLLGILFDRTAVVVTFLVMAALLVPLGVALARSRDWHWPRTLCAAATALGVALVVAVTLGRDSGHALQRPSCALDPGLSLTTSEAQANFVLFMPAAFFGYLATRRLALVLGTLLVATLGVEAVHSVSGLGFCQVADLVRNTAGAVLAGLAAVVVDRAVGATVSARREPDGRGRS